MPQEPAPIDIVYYTPDEFYVVLPKESWSAIGGYIYDAQMFMRAAGPCLKGNGSDIKNPPGGVPQ